MLQDIFTQGTLDMSTAPVAAAAEAVKWSDLLPNRILAVVVIAAIMLDINDLIDLFPKISDCIRRWKGNIGMEHSLSVARSRDIAAVLWSVAFCLAADSLDLYPARWMDGVPAVWSAAATIGLFFAYILARKILSLFLTPRRLDNDGSKAAHCALYTYIIALSIVALCTMGVMTVLHTPRETVKTVILWILAAFWMLNLLRTAQIIGSRCGVFSTFLYLCGLEILPAGLVVASAVFL